MRKLFLVLLLFLGLFTFGQTIPKPVGFIADYEKIFTPEQTSQLRKLVLDYEKETTIEIAVLTVDSIETDPGDFAQKTAEKWGIGKKGINNGLLILISKNKHVLRTQTGYGLEGYLPDGWLKHIGDSIASNYKGKYYEGTVELINKCKQRIGKEGYSQDHNKELIKQNKKKSEDLSPIEWALKNMSWWWLLIIVCIWIVIFIISPEAAMWILLFAFTKGESDSDSGGSFGGGLFGGGGSGSKW